MGSPITKSTRRILILICFLFIAIGNSGGPLLLRLYYVKGGSRIWLLTALQTAAFPIIFIPLLYSYFQRRKVDPVNAKLYSIQLPSIIGAAVVGLIVGVTNYMYSIASQRLPVSTTTLILASNLVFTAISCFFLVKQKFTPYSVNAIFLLTAGSAALALHASNERPPGESKQRYVMGLIIMFVAAALSGLLFPLIELIYRKSKVALTFSFVMEVQLVMNISATVFALIGMIVNNDFKVISREASQFVLGEVKYYVIIVSIALIFQIYFFGAMGIVFLSSALVTGIIITVLLPVTEVLAVIFFHDKFTSEKGMSLVLCLWGFVSHLYGEFRSYKKNNQIKMQESTTNTPNIAPAIELEP